jgi:hypothetical protein
VLNYDGRPNPVLQQSKFPLITKILGYSDPRIDLNSPFFWLNRLAILRNRISFLQDGSTILWSKTYSDILQQNNINLNYTPDFVIIELPAFIIITQQS